MDALSLNSFVAVPISADLHAEVARRYSSRVNTLIEDVVWNFLERTSDDHNLGSGHGGGLNWGSLWLPDGTEIRTKYYDEYKMAVIKSGEIVWNGKTFRSMSRLACKMRGDTSNNAWRVLEIKRPTDVQWQVADHLRR